MEEEIAEIVREYGWYAASVYDHDPPFLYSIGLMQTYDHPELIVFGLEPNDAHGLISNLFEAIRAGQSFKESDTCVLRTGSEEHRVGLRRVDPTQHPHYLGFAMGYCRFIGNVGELEAMQVFWSDAGGKFPFDVGCDLDTFRLQPRLDIPLTPSEVRRFERLWE